MEEEIWRWYACACVAFNESVREGCSSPHPPPRPLVFSLRQYGNCSVNATCNGRGTFDPTTCSCACVLPFVGDDCIDAMGVTAVNSALRFFFFLSEWWRRVFDSCTVVGGFRADGAAIAVEKGTRS